MNLNCPKIDSLRLLVPFDDVTINENHKVFTRTLTTTNEDGEVVGEEVNNAYRLHSNPCSSHYLNATTLIGGKVVRVIKLGFSAKTLKDLYFQGINKTNIDKIHSFILSEGVISLSKETLLKAKVVDVDICLDMLLQDSTVKDVISKASELSIPHKGTTANPFSKATNTGIEWGHRNKVGRSYRKKQYLKYYAKALELKHHSTIFYDTYLKPTKDLDKYIQDMKLLRVETTLKNSMHWATYNANVDTLSDLLSLDLSKYMDVFKRPINHYMTGAKHLKTRTDLTPTQIIQLEHFKLLQLHYNIDEEEAIQKMCFTACPDDRKKRYQYKKSLLKLVDENRVIEIQKENTNQTNIITELEKLNLIPKN